MKEYSVILEFNYIVEADDEQEARDELYRQIQEEGIHPTFEDAVEVDR